MHWNARRKFWLTISNWKIWQRFSLRLWNSYSWILLISKSYSLSRYCDNCTDKSIRLPFVLLSVYSNGECSSTSASQNQEIYLQRFIDMFAVFWYTITSNRCVLWYKDRVLSFCTCSLSILNLKTATAVAPGLIEVHRRWIKKEALGVARNLEGTARIP